VSRDAPAFAPIQNQERKQELRGSRRSYNTPRVMPNLHMLRGVFRLTWLRRAFLIETMNRSTHTTSSITTSMRISMRMCRRVDRGAS
jgi:hypothetical protein